jgi:hypothetical protein
MVDYDKNQIYRKCFSFTILAKATVPMEDKVIFGYPTTVVFNEYDLRKNIFLYKPKLCIRNSQISTNHLPIGTSLNFLNYQTGSPAKFIKIPIAKH